MFSLTDSMLTGVSALDGEHEALVACLNRLAAAEAAGAAAEARRELRLFRDELAHHFASEEAELARIGFPGRLAHADHHAEILAGIERMLDELATGTRLPGDIALECFGRLMRAVLLMDMQVVNWQADRVLA
ncbi:MAG: hemerythrin domain-containing protein [Alphaproteobacteria bacterium]|nr:hemerythrin domain-containing protein [Alphaproteobacteria bacterium]